MCKYRKLPSPSGGNFFRLQANCFLLFCSDNNVFVFQDPLKVGTRFPTRKKSYTKNLKIILNVKLIKAAKQAEDYGCEDAVVLGAFLHDIGQLQFQFFRGFINKFSHF